MRRVTKTLAKGWIPTALLAPLATLLMPPAAWGYVSGAVGAAPGGWSARTGINLERGLLGAQDVPESQQQQSASITSFHLNFARNFGAVGGLEDLTVSLGDSAFLSSTEQIGSTIFYPADRGHVVTLELSANWHHEVSRVVGSFVRFAFPIDVALEKFEQPKIDRIAFGFQGAYEISDTVAQEWLAAYGSGISDAGARRQNASLAASLLVAVRLNSVIQGWTWKAGPFLEADLTERNDAAYGTTAIRGFRAGLTTIWDLRVSPTLGLELGYVQKLSGAFFRATKDFFVDVSVAF